MPALVVVLVLIACAWYSLGFHIVKKPTPDQLFGCAQTFVNEHGEDTGECR